MPAVKGHENIPIFNHDHLAEIIRDNINYLCRIKQRQKQDIAKICNVSGALVTKWTSKKSPIIPAINNLLTIAALFEVDLEWLVTEHNEYRLPDYTKTYASAFSVLISLILKGVVYTTDIKDPILNYFLVRYENMKKDGVRQNDIDEWLRKINRAFDIPIREYNNDLLIHNDILQNEPGIAAVDEDMKYRNLARALNDEEIIDRAYKRVYGEPDDGNRQPNVGQTISNNRQQNYDFAFDTEQ